MCGRAGPWRQGPARNVTISSPLLCGGDIVTGGDYTCYGGQWSAWGAQSPKQSPCLNAIEQTASYSLTYELRAQVHRVKAVRDELQSLLLTPAICLPQGQTYNAIQPFKVSPCISVLSSRCEWLGGPGTEIAHHYLSIVRVTRHWSVSRTASTLIHQ